LLYRTKLLQRSLGGAYFNSISQSLMSGPANFPAVLGVISASSFIENLA
jgi:hypothetical protein